MTNADKIRNMSDEELTTYLTKLTEVAHTCDICEPVSYKENGCCDCHCEAGVLNWLKMKEED